MKYQTDFRLEDYILNTQWENLPEQVQERMKGCFLDLLGALIIGSKSKQFQVGLTLAENLYGKGAVPVVGAKESYSFMGAACAMGHSSNAFDIDDGHNIIRAHPGTSFVGPLLAAALKNDLDRNSFLTAALCAYETTVRMGIAIMDYYDFAHSSGTFGAIGTAAGVGRIFGFDRYQLNNALSVAEFNAPLVPGIRSVEYPSMNKDGVPFGAMIGCIAVMETLCGFTGNKNLLEADRFRHLLDDLGSRYTVMELYFKPYTCCRWAHPAIDACIELMNENHLNHQDVAKVTIQTFERATRLSKIIPTDPDEAQYNIAYPVAASLVYKDFGFAQVNQQALGDPKVVEMMKKLRFEVDEEFDKQFPAKRFCRAVIETVDGKFLRSKDYEPMGEASDNIGLDWLSDKFRRITGPVISSETQEALINLVCGIGNPSVRKIVDTVNADPVLWI